MRYMNIPDEQFTNKKGVMKVMHGERLAAVSADYTEYEKPLLREFDDVAQAIWGQNFEIMSYRLREQNVERLLCEDFNEKAIINIQVPPAES